MIYSIIYKSKKSFLKIYKKSGSIKKTKILILKFKDSHHRHHHHHQLFIHYLL